MSAWFVVLTLIIELRNFIVCFFFSNLAPLSCGSPDSLQNTTVVGKNTTVGSSIEYLCPKGHALIGKSKRNCDKSGVWSGIAPTCKCKFRSI